jgi:hypothetical protein
MDTEPTLRKPVGILMILTLILVWTVLVVTLAESIIAWPAWAQSLFYLIAGTAWILPLKPLLRWMEVGKWRE